MRHPSGGVDLRVQAARSSRPCRLHRGSGRVVFPLRQHNLAKPRGRHHRSRRGPEGGVRLRRLDVGQRTTFSVRQRPRRPRTLRAVTAAVNDDKADADPSNWIPSNPDHLCEYLGDWISIKARWGLSMDESEHGRIRNLLNERCLGQLVAPWPQTPPAVHPAPLRETPLPPPPPEPPPPPHHPRTNFSIRAAATRTTTAHVCQSRPTSIVRAAQETAPPTSTDQ